MQSILIVDDEKSVLKALRMILESKYQVITARQGSSAIKLFDQERPDLVLLDISLPDMTGIDVLKKLKEMDPGALVVMVTAVEDIHTIVKAVKIGAYDYLVKPIKSQELFLAVKNALENKALKNQLHLMQQSEANRYKVEIIGKSPEMHELMVVVNKLSRSMDTPVLIVGESGTGKGVFARNIHYSTSTRGGPFVTVNCAAIAKDLVESELFGYGRGAFTGAREEGKKGHFEEAEGGTLFLDEIGAMSLDAQAKLLSVLEDRKFKRVGSSKEVNVKARVIAATNSKIENAIEKGQFRKDLFFRLNVVKLEVPPLRDRKGDILLLTEHFLSHYGSKFGKRFTNISPEAKDALLQYHWPGNVRELRNILERVSLLEDGDTLLPKHFLHSFDLCKEKVSGLKADHTLDYGQTVRNLIKEALKRTRGNVVESAKLLNMPVHKLRYRIKKLGLKY
ncbi:acetoacetate metabolism regulatory protein AtoC [Desulfosarcina alkanivorans]|jgi:DNA-binding NtrC family response regulator|uniref:Acetoacetate metabolism regulatory protein AtoC n=1 Tax=Desulfosarcina alkanivorans TaxID=571177 RepID=A0A5K7YTU3_9BACT|nr:sigma-54 dependent transcriptional regulator [Desulfosarcina alkanivorans]BBO69704.1 acetoacetate metabolism regulatory protein AtoC [Desulfosarcina alkanivorans]